MSQLTKAEVESAVRKYWAVSTAKDAQQQQAFYATRALIFTSSSKKLEMAQLVSMHRQREYLAKETKFQATLSSIDVLPLGMNAAIAAYMLEFHVKNISTTGTVAKLPEEHLTNARMTQVFEKNEDGQLKIVHEHISIAQG